MIKQKKKRLILLFLAVWDLFSVAVSVRVAIELVPSAAWIVRTRFRPYVTAFVFVVFGLVFLFNIAARCYDISAVTFTAGEMLRLGLSVFFYLIIVLAADSIMSFRIPWELVIVAGILIYVAMLAGRTLVRLFFKLGTMLQNRGDALRQRVLIFGAGEAGCYLKNRLDNQPHQHLNPVVFIDDNPELKKRKIGGIRVHGGIEDMAEAVDKYNVKVIIVAIPTATRELLERVLKICRETKCQMKRFGSLDEIDPEQARLANINLEELLKRDRVHLNMTVVRKMVEGKVVLVTGGAGSIGTEICRQALRYNCRELIVFDFNENGLFEIDNELRLEKKYGNVFVRLGSVRDVGRLNDVFQEFRPQIVFHAAAHKHVPMMEASPCEAVKNNVFGTINVAQAANRYNADKFILISTDKAVNPTNIMGASKRVAEMAIQMFDSVCETDFAAVRFGNVLGSTGSVVPFFTKQIEKGGPVTVTHPDMRRYFMTIPEAVQLVLEAGAMAKGGEIFVLDMGSPVRIYDLACDLIRLSGLEPNTDIQITFTGLRPGEKLFEEIRLEDEDVSKTDNSKIFVLKPLQYDYKKMQTVISRLDSVLTQDQLGEMYSIMRELVPTFDHREGRAAIS